MKRPHRVFGILLSIVVLGSILFDFTAARPAAGAATRPPQMDDASRPPQTRSLERVSGDLTFAKQGLERLDASLSTVARLAQTKDGVSMAQLTAAAPELRTRAGRIQAVVWAEPGREDAVARQVVAHRGIVETRYQSLLQVLLPPEALESLSQHPSVRYMHSPLTAIQQEIKSEGLAMMGLDAWYESGFRGAGAKVAIADLGFDTYWNQLGSELPENVIARSFRTDNDITGGGDAHGTAAAEVVHDVAPEATLYLVNFGSEVELGNAVDWLIAEGVHVISSSVGWPGTAYGDGTGLLNGIVEKAERGGILWVQAAGNYAETHWTGTFADPDGNGFHNFADADEGNTISLRRSRPGEERVFRVEIFLTWDDWDALAQDYDLFLFRGDTVVAQSTAFQNGRFPPVEHIVFTSATAGDYWIGVQRFRANRRVKIDLVVTVDYELEHFVTAESLVVPGDSPYAVTVGAVAPGTLESRPYSSQGPTKDGRIKPDLVAGDQVSTTVYGQGGFFGTSAATPHVAGAAALLRSSRPDLPLEDVRRQLRLRAFGPGNGSHNTLIGAGYVRIGQLLGDVFLPIVLSEFPPDSSP